MDKPGWLTQFPLLADSNDPVVEALARTAQRAILPPGQTVFHAGSACDNYLLVTAGSVRVQLLTESGREVVLYRVRPGETCVLTTSCLMAGQAYPAEGLTDTEVEAMVLGRGAFDDAIQRSAVFRQFVFDNFAQRLAQVIARMEEVSFGAIDARLAALLLQGDTVLKTTHQELATELGSAREVVSRHLKRFEQHGWIRLSRGIVEVLEPRSLAKLRDSRPA